MKLILLSALSLLLLTSCDAPESELDVANKKIVELELKLEQEKAKNLASAPVKSTSLESPEVKDSSLNNQWEYNQKEDSMTGGVTYFATVSSTNTVNFSFPYNGEQHARLTFRNDPKYGKDILFRIEKGQILCESYDSCTVLVRFDDEKPTTYSASTPADNSTETVFISNYEKFMEKIRKAKMVRVSPTVYQEGAPVFEFDVRGFDEDKFKPKK